MITKEFILKEIIKTGNCYNGKVFNCYNYKCPYRQTDTPHGCGLHEIHRNADRFYEHWRKDICQKELNKITVKKIKEIMK